MNSPQTSPAVSRRGFLLGAGAGLVAGAASTWLGRRAFRPGQEKESPFTGSTVEVKDPVYAMPGPYPGRVIEVQHAGSVSADGTIAHDAVRSMVDRGMRELTGAEHAVEAWRRFFEPGDVVGVKVNPVGTRKRSEGPQSISSHELVLEVVEGLKSAGVRPSDIILFERYALQFRGAGYEDLLRERSMAGVRWYASSVEYENLQVDIAGHDYSRERDPNVVGYDPDVSLYMGYASPHHDPKDERRFYSHLSVIVSRYVNKIVTLPVLKDHGSAGVTLTLKNMSHGMNNNVARSHLSRYDRGAAASGPNQCNTFIPTAAGQELIRRKATLHIMDGLVGVYQGGPSAHHTWPYRSLFFGTDPVALDHVGWNIVDAKRAEVGMPPVGRMGIQSNSAAAREKEAFDRRQPEHIILAGTIGLGVFDADRIEHRWIGLT
jgi:uncharacterized protein (DUF362 family)